MFGTIDAISRYHCLVGRISNAHPAKAQDHKQDMHDASGFFIVVPVIRAEKHCTPLGGLAGCALLIQPTA